MFKTCGLYIRQNSDYKFKVSCLRKRNENNAFDLIVTFFTET